MALSGAFLLLLSAWLPWVRIRTAFGDILIRGTDGTEGYLAMGIALLALFLLSRSPGKLLLPALLAIALCTTELYDMSRSMNSRDFLASVGLHAEIGSGIFLLLFSALLLLLSALIQIRGSEE